MATTTERVDKIRVQLALIGCSHRTAPVELRERIVFSREQALTAADDLRRDGVLEEAVVVSTCNRSELYGVPADAVASPASAMEEYFTSFHGIPRRELDGRIYRQQGGDAVRHLFRVAAGLDSMLLGEAEILGQLRSAYGQALDHGATGPVLNRVFQGALEVGKRVRSETEVGARPMSVALAGVKLAERVFGNLKGKSALILGAGAVAEQVVEHMQNRGVKDLRVVNRSFDHAAELASRVGGEALGWDTLESVLGLPDVIVTSVSASAPVLTRGMLERAIAKRNGKPMFAVDLGVPRNIAEDASGLYSFYVYNIDDLGAIVEQNRKARESEIPRAEALIDEHVKKFEAWRAALEAGSIVSDLRERFHAQREALVGEMLAERGALSGVSADERERISRVTSELVEKLLEQPTESLRSGPGMRGRVAGLEALRHLFGLDRDSE
jgi:glutamyl-tRNA reductase